MVAFPDDRRIRGPIHVARARLGRPVMRWYPFEGKRTWKTWCVT